MTAFRVFQPDRLLLLVAILLALTSRNASGDPGKPDAFYQKNFADAPQVGGESMAPPESAHVATKDRPQRQQSSQAGNSRQDARVDSPQVGSKAAEIRTIISLYVSSQTKGHFETAVRKAFRVAETNRNIKLAEIYHIGDYRNVSPSIENEAKSRGIVLVGLRQVPSLWQVKDSPVWILRDGNGEHIVEGLMQIERCISSQGDYKEPERSMFEAPATPTIGVKSF